ncbi:hypothetical protein VR010_01640 [Actinomycetaceae bacterium L2_0104]
MKSVGILGAALATASALGMVLLALIARWLTQDENAAFIAIWGVVFSGGSILSVIEQETARQVTVSEARKRPVPGSVAQLALIALAGATLVLLCLSLLPLGQSVFGRSVWLVALTFVSLSGFGVQFMTRGILLGRQETGRYAFVIIAEAALRLVAIAILLALDVTPSITAAVAAVALGSFGWVPVARSAFSGIDWTGSREPWRRAGHRIFILAASNALLAPLMTGYPTLVSAIIGSSTGLATFFSVVTISRVPLTLLSPVQALVVPMTTRALLEGRGSVLRKLQLQLLAAIAAAAAVAAAGGWVLGPWAVQFMFGPDYQAARWLVAVLLGMTVIFAGALLQVAVFISLERYHLIAATWGAALLGASTAIWLTPGDATARGTAGFITASIIAYIASTIALRRALAKSNPDPRENPAA